MGTEEIVVLGVSIVVGTGLWFRFCWHRPAIAFAMIVAVVVFSSHVLSLAYTFGSPAVVIRYAIGIKDVMAWILFSTLIVRAYARSQAANAILLVVFIGTLFGVLLALNPSPVGTAIQLQSMRGALVPSLALGSVALLTHVERRRVAVLVAWMIATAAVYSIIELLFPATYLTNFVGVGRYWTEVKQLPLFVNPENGLPWNFENSSGFRRLSGSFGDPLSAGAVLGSGVVLTTVMGKDIRYRNVILAIMSCATLLTFTRAGWILAVAGTVGFVWRERGPSRAIGVLLGGCLGILLVATFYTPLGAYLSAVFSGSDGSTLAHQQALASSATYNLSAFGTGWGTGGSLAKNGYSEAVSSESSYLALGVQIGAIGLLLLMMCSIALAHVVIRGSPYAVASVGMLLAIGANGFVSENLLTFNGAFVPLVTAGLVSVGRSTELISVDRFIEQRQVSKNEQPVDVHPREVNSV